MYTINWVEYPIDLQHQKIGEQMSQAKKLASKVNIGNRFQVADFNLNGLPDGHLRFRPTVVGLLIIERHKIILVQSSKDPTRETWGLPQGGIKPGEIIINALIRETREELGIVLEEDKVDSAVPLGRFLNVLPKERKVKRREEGEDALDKLLHFTALPLVRYPAVCPNYAEIRDFEMVESWPHLWSIMKTVEIARQEKFLAVLDAVFCAVKKKLLDWGPRPGYMPH